MSTTLSNNEISCPEIIINNLISESCRWNELKWRLLKPSEEKTNNRYLQGLTAALWTGRLGRQVPPSGGERVQAIAVDPHFVVFLV